jgi:hypothetical protein
MLGIPEVRRDGRAWAVRLVDHSGQLREFRYRHESQARFFAEVFKLQPRVLPSQGTLPPKRKRTVQKPRILEAVPELRSVG